MSGHELGVFGQQNDSKMMAKRGTILLMNTQDTPNTRHPSNHDGQHHTHDDTTTQNTTHATASLFRTSTITLLFQILLVGLGFGISIILARWLGASGRGAYTLMLLTAMLLARFGSLGIEVSNAYYAAHRDAPLPAMIANSLLVCLVGKCGTAWSDVWYHPIARRAGLSCPQ